VARTGMGRPRRLAPVADLVVGPENDTVDIPTIHLHDTVILRVIEDAFEDTLTFEVDYPRNWDANVFSRRWLVFDDVLDYRVCEGPFHGLPTVLAVQAIGVAPHRTRLRLETNAGFRELTCRDLRLLEHSPRANHSVHRTAAGDCFPDVGSAADACPDSRRRSVT